MPRERQTSARTKRGNRVYRNKFRHKGEVRYAENYTFLIKRDGRKYYFNLGSCIDDALKQANRIDAFLSIPSHSVDQLFDHPDFEGLERSRAARKVKKVEEEKKQERHVPTAGEFVLRYTEAAAHLSPTTVLGRANSLRRIAAFICGLDPVNMAVKGQERKQALKKWRAKVDSLPVSAITPERLEKFKASMVRRAKGNHLQKARHETTCNSYLRAAGSMFSRKWDNFYMDFELPDPNPFREVKPFREPCHRYVSKFDVEELIEKAEEELKDAHPASYVAFVLALFCGMRRSEIDLLIWDQVDLEGGHIWIRTTPYFTPKARNSESRIDAVPRVFEVLRDFRPHSIQAPFVLPCSGNPDTRPRCMSTFRHLLDWLRKNGVDHVTALHALRKEAGSLIYKTTGSVDVAADFLRNDPRVAREHYIGRKGRLELNIATFDLPAGKSEGSIEATAPEEAEQQAGASYCSQETKGAA